MQDTRALENVLNTPQKKLAFFQNLILIAAADGRLEDKESDFIVDIGNRLGLSPEEVAPIADNLGVLSFIIPEEGLQKTLELQTLVMMMVEDGRIHDHEYTLCLDYAYRIGYGKEILDEMISQLSANQAAGRAGQKPSGK
ncbi:MAG: TerB family tellurite resistance protein [Adhaeribacter sp.]